MYKKIYICILVIILLLQTAYCDDKYINISIDGRMIDFSKKPVSIKGNVIASLETLVDALGATIYTCEDGKNFFIERSYNTLELKLNSKNAFLNGRKIEFKVAPIVVDNIVMVPVKSFAEALNFSVNWDNNTKTVIIKTKYEDRSGIKPGDLVIDLKLDNNIVETKYRGNEMLNYDYMVEQTDTDGDGLTDYEETYKYLTNPKVADSDNDGISDGEWDERREYTYTIEAVRELDIWFNFDSFKDTFQDVELIYQTDNKLRYKVILYPYAKDEVIGNPDWKKYATNPEFRDLLKPRKTTNWDETMQKEILASIPQDCKTDLDVVNFLVPYYFNSRVNPSPIKDPSKGALDLSVDIRGDKAIVSKANAKNFSNKEARTNKNISDQELIKQILFGKEMYNKNVFGACSESATYMTTILRAAGIPARIIETNSLLDNFSDNQRKLINNLKNENIKKQLLNEEKTYAGHHLLEAYVGGRWIKIDNDSTICQSIYLGNDWSAFLLKSDTYFDLADTPVSDIWEYGYPRPMPYKLISLSDRYGKYYDEKRQPYYKDRYRYGIDINNIEKVYVFGGEYFCVNTVGPQFSGYEKIYASINYFEDNILESDTNLIVIQKSQGYSNLPIQIKNVISFEQFDAIKNSEYYTFRIDNTNIVILDK